MPITGTVHTSQLTHSPPHGPVAKPHPIVRMTTSNEKSGARAGDREKHATPSPHAAMRTRVYHPRLAVATPRGSGANAREFWVIAGEEAHPLSHSRRGRGELVSGAVAFRSRPGM